MTVTDLQTDGPVVVLAGGTGGAKLARGMLDVVGPERLVVIANTGDDIEIHGGYVSPDPDLIAFWLADRIDSRGWGLAGDTFAVMDGLRELGETVWFNLGDADLALALLRARALGDGERLSDFHLRMSARLGARGRVLVMSDAPVRTRIQAEGRMWSLQEYLIQGRGEDGVWPTVEDVQFHGAAAATPTPEVLEAIAGAAAIVIGPSNPIISIGPILALPGLADALRTSPAPTVAVSPFVQGQVLKGPTAQFMAWRGLPADSAGLADLYADLVDGLILDAALPATLALVTNLLMADPESRARLARETLTFAAGIGPSPPNG
ncbi:MAG TPA: 2-phospho-L-lactate transferase CofD family protein [Solirubrobacteraceae bacterium]|nr:2-phospho-L-lactate transferase CofD family protein [Solirubrobacteraceae bacterium]